MTLGLVMPTEDVERTLRVLRKLQLIDNRFEWKRMNRLVIVPLSHDPSCQERSRLREQCRDMRVEETNFLHATVRPRNLREAVRNRIPDNLMSMVRSFDMIGDIAVLELPKELEKFASAIANGILDVNPYVRMVLKKSSDVSGPFRTRRFEVISGVGSTDTFHREFSCRFHLDVAEVYFNARLSHERMRVAQQVRNGDCVVDMFAGVGPYTVLIAKLRPSTRVYAIDINPAAFRYLKENILLNGVADRVIPVQGDARHLATTTLRGVANRVIMNLPSEAKNFLDAATLLLAPKGGTVHFYTFASRNESLEKIKDWVLTGIEKNRREVESFLLTKVIKEVAPNRVEVAIDAVVR